MSGNRQQFIARLILIGLGRLEHEMFFVLQNLLGIRKIGKCDTSPLGWIGCPLRP